MKGLVTLVDGSQKMEPLADATTPAELKICERFVLSQVQPFMEKSNDQNQFAYKKARSTLDAVGLLAHTIAKSLDGGSKVQKTVFVDFAVLLIPSHAHNFLIGSRALEPHLG